MGIKSNCSLKMIVGSNKYGEVTLEATYLSSCNYKSHQHLQCYLSNTLRKSLMLSKFYVT